MKFKIFSRNEINATTTNFIDIRHGKEDTIFVKFFYQDGRKGINEFREKCSINIPRKKIATHATQYGLFLDGNGQFTQPINLTSLSNTRDGYNILNLLSIGDKNPVVNFYSRDDDTCVIITDYPVSTDLELRENVVGFPYEIYKTVFGESYNTRYKTWEAKRDILLYTDPNQCLAYLEAQLDLLTNLVFLMVRFLAKEEQAVLAESFPEIETFKEVYEKSSLLNVKAIQECLKEMQITKANLRTLQTNYYKLKQAKNLL